MADDATYPRWALSSTRIYVGGISLLSGIAMLRSSPAWTQAGESWESAFERRVLSWVAHASTVGRALDQAVILPHLHAAAAFVAWGAVIIGAMLLASAKSARLAAPLGAAILGLTILAEGESLYSPGASAVYFMLVVTLILGSEANARHTDPTRVPRWTAVPLRLYLGAGFARAASNKVGPVRWEQWPGALHHFVGSQLPNSYRIARPFLEHVVVGHSALTAPVVAVAEVSVATLLVLGLGTRLAATVGAVLTINYFMMKGTSIVEVSNDFAFVMGLLLVWVAAAGRVAGLDAVLAKRYPVRWLW